MGKLGFKSRRRIAKAIRRERMRMNREGEWFAEVTHKSTPERPLEDAIERTAILYGGSFSGSGYAFATQTRDLEYSFKEKDDAEDFRTHVRLFYKVKVKISKYKALPKVPVPRGKKRNPRRKRKTGNRR